MNIQLHLEVVKDRYTRENMSFFGWPFYVEGESASEIRRYCHLSCDLMLAVVQMGTGADWFDETDPFDHYYGFRTTVKDFMTLKDPSPTRMVLVGA